MITVNDIFKKVGLKPSQPYPWGTVIPEFGNGVYVISTSSNPAKNEGITPQCTIEKAVFKKWKELSPDLNVDGENSINHFQNELNKYWKPNQNILYIGESSSETNGLSKRIKQFYDHQVGCKGPHTGGYWIKLLAQLNDLNVYYAVCDNPRDTEFKMLMYFIEKSIGKSFYELQSLGSHLPFANLKVDFQKKHGISNAVSKNSRKKK